METQQVNPKSQNLENSRILLKDLLDPKEKKFKTQNKKGDLISISHFASKQIDVRSTFPNGSSKKESEREDKDIPEGQEDGGGYGRPAV